MHVARKRKKEAKHGHQLPGFVSRGSESGGGYEAKIFPRADIEEDAFEMGDRPFSEGFAELKLLARARALLSPETSLIYSPLPQQRQHKQARGNLVNHSLANRWRLPSTTTSTTPCEHIRICEMIKKVLPESWSVRCQRM